MITTSVMKESKQNEILDVTKNEYKAVKKVKTASIYW